MTENKKIKNYSLPDLVKDGEQQDSVKKNSNKYNSNKYKRAIGLAYDEIQNAAPTLLLKGARLRADEIVELAKKYNIPIIENPALAKALETLELDQEIPEELYEAVALLLNQIEQYQN